jgi:hypothetical protein
VVDFLDMTEPYFPNGIPYVEGTILGVNRNGPASNVPVIYINTTPGDGYTVPYSNNSWGWVDLTGRVPVGTKAVFLGGIMSVMIGTYSDGATLTAAFGAGDSSDEPPYIIQAVAIQPGQGTRESVGVWAPLDQNLWFRFKPWWRTNSGSTTPYPEGCAFFLSLRVEAYLR